VGIVGAVNVPKVRRDGSGATFVCVDFEAAATGHLERAAVNYNNIVLVHTSDERSEYVSHDQE
jgi:hypothetical protein